MRFTLLLIVCLFCSFLSAQTAENYLDVVHRYEGDDLVGKLVKYEFGKEVVIKTKAGKVRTVLWDEIKRVSFKRDEAAGDAPRRSAARSPARPTAKRQELPKPDAAPSRKWLHSATGNMSLGSIFNADFGFSTNRTAVGIGLSYHIVRPLGPVHIGAGLDLNLLNHARQELIGATTAFVEYQALKSYQIQPVFRLEGGPAWPFGGGALDEEFSDRKISPLIHPSVGLVINPRRGTGWSQLTFDLGYRFLNSSFTLTTVDLDVIERRVSYRRLVLRGGVRF